MIYTNEVVEEYLTQGLNTLLDVEALCNVDDSLEKQDGEKVKVIRYSGTGSAEFVAEGEGNTGYSDIDGQAIEYEVKVAQDRTKATDEEMKRNGKTLERKLENVKVHLVNKLRHDIMLEYAKSHHIMTPADTTDYVPTYAELMTAQTMIPMIDGGINGDAKKVYCYMSPDAFLKFQLSLSSNVIIQSQMIDGKQYQTVNGLPIKVTDECGKNGIPKVFLATDKAVRLLKSTCVSSEQNRLPNIRTTEYYNRLAYCPYLEFESDVVLFKAKES